MVTRKHSNRTPNQPSSSSSQVVEELLASFHSSQELKLPELKSLYYLLVHFSLDPVICCTSARTNSSLSELKIGLHGISVPFSEICSLSDLLCKIFSKMFKEFLCTSQNVPASYSEKDSSYFDICTAAQRLNLILRCCMVMLKLLVLDQNRLVKNGRVLHAILAKLCSLNVNRENELNAIHFEEVSQEYKWDDTHSSLSTEECVASLQFFEPIDQCRHFFCTMLEVFVDELSAHGQLREYFMLIDSYFSVNKLFLSHPNQGDIGSVLELVCTHFCMSFSNEQTFETIDDKLFGFPRGKSRAPELGSLSALTLLLNPIMLTAPKYLQAHLICLASESIVSDMGLQNDKLVDCYLAAFERSVVLYIKHTSPSDGDSAGKFSAYKGNSRLSFESYIRPATRKQLDHLISKLDDLLQLRLEHRRSRSRPDLIASCIEHITNNKEFFSTSFKDEIISISSSIIVNVFPDEVTANALCTGCHTKPENIYLLASIMKLMSWSLLQATRCLMYTGDLDCSRTLKDLSTCKEYDLLMEVIRRFKNCSTSLPIQKSFITAMDTYPERHKEVKLMLFHFLGLLSLSFKGGICFLSKGCISVIIALINLLLFEEGHLEALRPGEGVELYLSSLRKENSQEAVAYRKSSLVIASKYEKARARYLRPSSSSTGTENDHENQPCVVGIEEETVETCNGSVFLKCFMKEGEKPADFDDLADFVECKKDKDYSGWLRDREMYRKKKYEKMAVFKWKRKKRIWKYMKANGAYNVLESNPLE